MESGNKIRNKNWYRHNFKLSSTVIGNSNDEYSFPHNLLLTNTQALKISKALIQRLI